MSYEVLQSTLKQGREVRSILENALNSRLCMMANIFENISVIGKGVNGIVYFLPFHISKSYFPSCSTGVAIKEIEVEGIQKKFSHSNLDADGNYICSNQPIAEILNSVICTELVKTGKTPHLTQFITGFGCGERYYLVYEFCGYRLKSGVYSSVTLSHLPLVLKKRSMDKRIVMEVCFTILHTIHVMQSNRKIIHQDLKPDNIMIQPITRNSVYKDTPLKDVDYFCYSIGGKKFYLRNRGFLLKIGDYGIAATHEYETDQGRKVKIMSKNIHKEGETKKRLQEKFGITGKYSECYDAHFFLPQLWFLCGTWKVDPPRALLKILKDNNMQVSHEYNRPFPNASCQKSALDLMLEVDWERYLLSNIHEKKTILYI